MRDMIGGKTFAELGIRLLRDSQRPVLPETRDRGIVIPGRNGIYDFGADLGSRTFLLRCTLITRNAAQLQQEIRRLAVHLLDAHGKPRTLELRLAIDIDKVYYVRYAGNLPIERIAGLGTFVLPLVAHDPHAYQTDLSTEITWDSELSMDSDLTFDDEFVHAVNDPGVVQINNFGSIAVEPIVEITGSFTTISLFANGKTLVYGESLSSATLIIDCNKMTAKVGILSKLNKLSGSFIELLPGINSVTISGTGLNCSVSFIFAARYM